MRMPSRRAVLGGGAGIALSTAAGAGLGLTMSGPASGASRADPDRPLRIGYLPITDAAPLLAAHGRGLFAAHGVPAEEPVMLRGWAGVGEALLAGSVDLVHLLYPMAMQMRIDLDADIRVISGIHENGGALTVAPDITQPADLAGRTVAIPAWFSIHTVITQMILRADGLTPVVRRTPNADRGEVALVPMAPADMVPGLATGSLAGFSVADPFNAMGEGMEIGAITRYLGDVWRAHPCCVAVAGRGLLNRPAAQVQGVADALLEAQHLCARDRDGVAELLSERYLPQPLPAIREAMTRTDPGHAHVENPDWDGETISFGSLIRPGFTERLVRELRTTVKDAPTRKLGTTDPADVHDLVVADGPARAAARRADPTALGALSVPEKIAP